MKWVDDYQLFLFDFDGLLVNSEPIHYQAYVDMCARRGFVLQWSYDQFCVNAHHDAKGLERGIYEAFPQLFEQEPNWKILYAEKKRALEELLARKKIDLMPGVERLLKQLDKKDIRRCVVTNSTKAQTDLIKANQPLLKTIPFWITREDYLEPKPNSECYEQAIRKYGIRGDRVIGFEDSLKGLRALMGTTAQPVLICPKDHPQLEASIDHTVIHYASFEEIPDLHLL